MNDLFNEFNLLSLNNQQKNLIHLESFFNNLLNYHDNNCPWIYIYYTFAHLKRRLFNKTYI